MEQWHLGAAYIAGGDACWDERNETLVAFRGEVYPKPARGALLRSYKEEGESFYGRLNGRFCGVVADRRRGRITLFNDRYGLGRIYYLENEDGFYFSSAAKALLRAFPETRDFDPRSLAEYCSCGCVLQNRSLFRGISILPAGAKWIFSPETFLRKETYFDRSVWENQTPLNGEQYFQALKTTFREVLPHYLRTEQDAGMSLTGGLDGRMIMAWAKPAAGELPCYTFGSSLRESTDVKIARRVAEACEQPHTTIEIGSDFLKEFPVLAEEAIRVSDGGLDVTGAVEIYANRQARKIAPVRVTGSYGSEILRGNVAFKAHPLNEGLFSRELVALGAKAAGTFADEANVPRQSFIAFKQIPWHHQARLAVEESQVSIATPFLDNALVGLSFRAPELALASADPSLRLIREGNAALARIPTDRGITFQPSPLSWMQGAFEQFRFKAEYAYDYGMPQWLAKFDHAIKPFRPEKLFLGRHKFYHFRTWYRDALAPYVKEILLDDRTRGRWFLQGAHMEKMVQSHVSGTRNYTSEISQILTLELIERHLLAKE